MTNQIDDYAQNEKDLYDFEDCWQEYREAVRHGISSMPEVMLRNLHNRFAMLSAHAEMRAAIARGNEARAKNALALTEKQLLVTTYKTGAMNARTAQLGGDETYKEANERYEDTKYTTIIEEGKAKACAIVVSALSREIGKYK